LTQENDMTDIPSREAQPIQVRIDGVVTGSLLLPQRALGLVLFAHGRRSSHYSRRNRALAEVLNRGRLATVLFDLLTPEEQAADRPAGARTGDTDTGPGANIALLTERVIHALDWTRKEPRLAELPLGLFGSGTGAAAALGAAAERRNEVRALVCRGARTDLAAGALSQVVTPTLLVVAGLDPEAIRVNRPAIGAIPAEAQLEIIDGATRLFEEAGKLDSVGLHARDWFLSHFADADAAAPTSR
jgi:pimeloyl-ACP methyl ester carboxylesterase